MERGEIWHVDLKPVVGREQRGERYVLIVSPRQFNVLGTPLVCPITIGGPGARAAGWAVTLMGTGTSTSGVVLVNQARTMDLKARNGRRHEVVPDHVVDEVLALLSTLLE